jgi:hypothetical protein
MDVEGSSRKGNSLFTLERDFVALAELVGLGVPEHSWREMRRELIKTSGLVQGKC